MKSLKRPKLSDMVAESLINFILGQGLKPGDKLLSEVELANKLGIGRTSVREGVRQLEATGLFTIRQGYGITLNKVTIDTLLPIDSKFNLARFLKMTKEEILDLMDFRLLLELEACRLAVERINSEDLKVLDRLLGKMDPNTTDMVIFIEPDMKFHRQIAAASGNMIYLKIYGLIGELFWKQQLIVASLPGATGRAYQYHKNIISALREKDADKAVRVLKEHLEDTKKALSENL